jgi:hypothetical protein
MRSKLFILISFFVLAITMMHAQTCVAPPQGLVAWWAAEGNANDSAGANSGSINGNVTFVNGKVGEAFHFDGTDFVRVPNSASLNPPAMSFEGWIRATEQSQLMENSRAVVFAKAGSCGYGGYGTILSGSGIPVLASPFVCIPDPVAGGNNFATSDLSLGTYPLLDGQWHHLALVYAGNEGTPYVLTRAYVDGTLASLSSWGRFAATPIANSTADLFIGGFRGSESPFVGDVDELSIYNRALTATEIQQIYTAGSAGKCTQSSPLPPPSITSISPPAGMQGTTVTHFTVTGSNFVATSTIAFSGSAADFAVTYQTRTSTQIIASVAVSANAALGVRDVLVVNPDGQSATAVGALTVRIASFVDAVRDRVVPQIDAAQDSIAAKFQPGFGLSLKDAARLGGYDHFNWIQIITRDDVTSNPLLSTYNVLAHLTYCLPGYIANGWFAVSCANIPSVPYFDPPPGGYVYQGASLLRPAEDDLDWYDDEFYTTDPPSVLANHQTTFTGLEQDTCRLEINGGACPGNPVELDYFDFPTVTDPNFIFQLDPFFHPEVDFTTALVGVRADGTGDVLNLAACDVKSQINCSNISGTAFIWNAIGGVVGITQTRLASSGTSASGTSVYFGGFIAPGAAGLPQAELELLARTGVNIRGEDVATAPVIIDIKPGELPNSINRQSLGNIPVAIISTNTFSAPNEISISSLRFGPGGTETAARRCEIEDVNNDGISDLLCHFSTPDANFQDGDTIGTLTGSTVRGLRIYGKDSVRIIAGR